MEERQNLWKDPLVKGLMHVKQRSDRVSPACNRESHSLKRPKNSWQGTPSHKLTRTSRRKKCAKILDYFPLAHLTDSKQSRRRLRPPQSVIPLRGTSEFDKKLGWFAYGVVTFCQDKVSGPGVSTQRVPKIRSWLAMTALWNNTCTPRSTWIEYEGTSKHGRGLWNMLQWVFRISQSDWEIRSQALRPLMLAKSKGPWVNVSWCVKVSHFLKGRSLWRVA